MNSNNQILHKKRNNFVSEVITAILFTFTLYEVFITDNSFHSVIKVKYFWFYGSIGLASVASLVYVAVNWRGSGGCNGKDAVVTQSFRFSQTDGFVLLFVGSVFLIASGMICNQTGGNDNTCRTSLRGGY